MSYKKPTLEFFRKTAEAKGGNISEMAKAFDCDRRTIHYWLEKNDKFKDVLDQVNESFVDLAETRLHSLVNGIPKIEEKDGKKVHTGWIERPSEAAVFFTLKTKGKSRGYIERYEQTGKDGAPLMPIAPPVIVMSPEEYAKLEAEEREKKG